MSKEPAQAAAHGPIRPVRLAGSARLADGTRLTWTVADGRRGRRWRSVTTGADGRLLVGLLLEAGTNGRLAKLELAAPDGLLTLHPQADETSLHGNVVRAGGVAHVSLAWSPEHMLLVDGSPIAAAVALRGLAARIGVGEGYTVPAVLVERDLRVRVGSRRVHRAAEDRWRIETPDGAMELTVEVDVNGIPAWPDGSEMWPLELEPAG